MNFVKRAWLNLRFKKGRTALLILVTSAIMLFVLAGLLIKSAATTATQQAKDSVGATLTLSANREAAFKKMRSSTSTTSGKPTMPKLTTSPVKLSTAKKIAALSGVSSYSATVSTSANAKGFDAIETSSSSSGFGGKMPGGSTSSGDITVSGVTSTASNSNFSNDTYTITSGRGLKASDADTKNVVIETNLAKSNSLKVGSTIKLKATTGSKSTYTLKVVGIYKAKSSATASMGPGQSDPANTVFTGTTFANTLKGSKYAGTADSVTFNVSTPSKVASVKAQAKKLINTSKYSINSDDASYQMVKASMKSVTGFANKIVWLVVIAGTIILALIVILMIRERRYEIGVLLSLGESRMKIIAQFFVELLVVLVIGVGVAGVGGKFVGDKLAQQIVSTQTTTTSTTNQMGGMPGGSGNAQGGAPSGQMGNRANAMATQKQKQTKLSTQVTPQAILLLIAVGLVIIFIAILVGAGGILRLQPKKVLIG
ncbi:ABC transporter permease [Lacticaseibacillus porcinae]|uniref:ABC transporter permease n=1 Tax=Lacticaseibacillus porcinae TaxID=1123687 RepID=UPI000F779EC4|nr:ABC transporter permease [Lacticaseibacillus porcinae]